jgi:hypothetical protein
MKGNRGIRRGGVLGVKHPPWAVPKKLKRAKNKGERGKKIWVKQLPIVVTKKKLGVTNRLFL